MAFQIIFQSTSTYSFIYILLMNERFENLRNFLRSEYTELGMNVIFGVALCLIFPGMIFLQNLMATLVMILFGKPDNFKIKHIRYFAKQSKK